MRKLLLLVIIGGSFTIRSNAQVANYAFSTDNTNYTEITGGTLLGNSNSDDHRFVNPAVPLGDIGSDADTGVGLPIGFNFVFNGEVFNVFGINNNGWLGFGKTSLSPSVNLNTDYSHKEPINGASTAPAIQQNRVVAFGRDLKAKTGASLRYQTIGSSPNRILVVQWKNYRKTNYYPYDFLSDSLNFQIKLYETINIVEFVYGRVITPDTINAKPQVGLRGSSNTDFFNRTSSTSWSASAAGTLNTDVMKLNNQVFPASGLVYRFTPMSVNIENKASTINPDVNVFPNPTNDGIVNIIINGLNKAQIAIYTIQGQMVYSENIIITSSSKQLDLSYLSKGVYMLRISDDNNNILNKIFIQ